MNAAAPAPLLPVSTAPAKLAPFSKRKIMIEKIFKAYDVRAVYPNPLNEDAAWKVGHATAQFLKRSRQGGADRVKLEDTIVVGRDMRPSSPSLAKALIDGISSVGMNVIDVGMIDTSFMYFAINHLDAVGGIQTTASHNPIQYNGFKISGPKAKPIGAATGLDDIKRIASSLRPGQTGLSGKLESRDLWVEYRKHVLQFLELKRPIRVVVDASNGMAGKMVPAVFDGVPNLQIVPVLFEITGSFTHEPNPLVEENLDLLKRQIGQEKPDLGVCFDGDADRCVFVDENQKTIGCDIITALMARDFLQMPRNKGSTIVYDLRSSHVVADEVKAAGGVPKRDRVGHAFIKKTMAETKSVFGGELSGHFYFRDNFYADSGAIAFARVLSVLSAQPKPLGQLVAPLHRYSQSGEVNFQVEDKDGKIRELADIYKKSQVDYLDGITLDLGDWWFNVRKSNTEPLLRLNLEAKTPRMMEEKFGELKKVLGEPVHGH
jgi:phosphomannomutase